MRRRALAIARTANGKPGIETYNFIQAEAASRLGSIG